ncbi:uncharacterized protein DSM5745_11274 [Aspergillus mulundensis]|uniref:Uncharacterized protein n=1 Tax=Aspergillus mulundensis TaxID=1810919 RepID=A0A3D8Q8U5_9EURO|nr:hypothetical protein DSM5745_11274 [Aspergillus mulundensis]RDW58262.1 hypothetical protein DSM5745_11274 [Aspergillus mulundensis]
MANGSSAAGPSNAGSSNSDDTSSNKNETKTQKTIRELKQQIEFFKDDKALFAADQKKIVDRLKAHVKQLETTNDDNVVTWSRGMANDLLWLNQAGDSGYKNVLGGKPSAQIKIPQEEPIVKTNSKKRVHRPKTSIQINDDHFRDRLNNILQSGQSFMFVHLRYRAFIDKNTGMPIDPAPVRPILSTLDIDEITKVPVGILSDCTPPTYKATRTNPRAGKSCVLKPIMPQPKEKDAVQYVITGDDQTLISRGDIEWYPSFAQFDDEARHKKFQELANDARLRYGRKYLSLLAAFEPINRKWIQARKLWEFELITELCKNPLTRWPKGTSAEEVAALGFEELITTADEIIPNVMRAPTIVDTALMQEKSKDLADDIEAQTEAAKVIKFLKKRHGKGGTKHSRAVSLDSSDILKRPISKRSCEQFVEYLKQRVQQEDPDIELPQFTDDAANNVPIYESFMGNLGFALDDIERKDWKK